MIAQIHRWQVAKLLCDDSRVPRDVFRSIFSDATKLLEERHRTIFSPSLQERVWTSVSPHYLNTLREKLTQAVQTEILDSYPNHEISKIFEEHLHSGAFPLHHEQALQKKYEARRQIIKQRLRNEAISMIPKCVEKIRKAVSKEGVFLPGKYFN